MAVVVGTANQVKVDAAHDGFERVGLTVSARGIDVASQVSEQPMTLEETIRGAHTRAMAASDLAADASFAVGMEGGCYEIGSQWFETGVIVVRDNAGRQAMAMTVAYPVPPRVLAYLLDGQDIDEAMEAEVGIVDIGSGTGFYAYMTRDGIDRQQAYADAVVVALSRWLRPELWDVS